jgi:hypothetical protein
MKHTPIMKMSKRKMTAEEINVLKEGGEFSPLIVEDSKSSSVESSSTIDLDSEDEAALEASKPKKPLKKSNRKFDLVGGELPVPQSENQAFGIQTQPQNWAIEKAADLERTQLPQ